MHEHKNNLQPALKAQFQLKNSLHLVVLSAALLFVILIILTTNPLGSNVINNESNATFETEWQYQIDDGNFQQITLPRVEAEPVNDHIILKNSLPNKVIKGATVLIRTSLQDVKVSVAGEQIYSSRDLGAGMLTCSSAYHFVRLPTDCEGMEIEIELSSPYPRYSGMMNQIYIGSKASNLFYIIRENGLWFVIGFLIFIIGFFLMIAFLFAKDQESKAAIIYLGAFFACAGYWLLVESRLVQVFIPHPMALTNSSILALSLLPVFSGLYYYHSHTRIFKRFGKCLIGAVILGSLGIGIAAIADPGLPPLILPTYLIFMAIYMVAILVSVVVEGIRSGKLCSTPVFGIICFGICGLIELFQYLFSLNDAGHSFFLTLGLVLFCLIMGADTIQNFTRVQQAAGKVNSLTVLAYTDSLTGLENRTAFLEKMSTLGGDTEGYITIAMYDINNLKEMNDSFGHMMGDAMICRSVKALKSSIRQDDSLYRIGGDEFVAILTHFQPLEPGWLENRLMSVLEKENSRTQSYQLSIAYGFATYSKDTDANCFATLSRADEEMYLCKKRQKEQQNQPAHET